MPKQAINEIRCTFLSRSENEALARSIISGFLLPLDPTVDELADIRCAISEAVTNSCPFSKINFPNVSSARLCLLLPLLSS